MLAVRLNDVLAALDEFERGALLALVVAPGVGLAVAAVDSAAIAYACVDPCRVVSEIETELRPRWVMWSGETTSALIAAGVRVATSWDIAAVHRLLFGGWQADPARVWALTRDLSLDAVPVESPIDLFHQGDDSAPDAITDAGHLHPSWATGGWARDVDRLARWASLAATVAQEQQRLLAEPDVSPRSMLTARSESTIELLCTELAADGLPVRRAAAEEAIASVIGPRPRSHADAEDGRRERDLAVLRHVSSADDIDLRSPGQVKSLLRRAGIEVPDTRAWRLREMQDVHPVVAALLAWRKAERVATTYGYAWLDQNVAADGRLRGAWSGCDGAAGRMTASAGLHNMPADMRGAVVAEPGHVFVRADLGQIEPRVLAVVSGDKALVAATQDDDLYAPIAAQLGVDRAIAKVAFLGAMYGQTTGRGAQVAGRLETTYPTAMGYLRDADRAAQGGRSLRTFGGRLISVGSTNAHDVSERDHRRIAASRGRYGRNAMVQGAAAELFKLWAVIVRARGATINARIVLCLHDELLVHVPEERGENAAQLVNDALAEAVHRWAPGGAARFVAEVSVITRWSEAKR